MGTRILSSLPPSVNAPSAGESRALPVVIYKLRKSKRVLPNWADVGPERAVEFCEPGLSIWGHSFFTC